MGMIGNAPVAGTIGTANIQDGGVTTADIADGAVTAAKLAATAVTDKLGYTPVNKAGDTLTGTLKVPDNLASLRRSNGDEWLLGLSAPDANGGVEVSLGTQSGSGANNTLSLCSGSKKTIAGDKDGNVTTYGYLKTPGGLRSPNDGTVVANADNAMPPNGGSMIYTLSNGPGSNDGHIIGMSFVSSSTYGSQIWLDTDPTYLMAMRQRNSVGVWNAWSYIHNTNTYKVYTANGGSSTSTSGVRGSVSITLNSSSNKILCFASDLVRCSSGYVRGELRLDGSPTEYEFMYQQSTANSWQTTTGIATLNNIAAGSHTIDIYANFTYATGAAWDGPTYLQVIVWDGI